MIELAEDRNFAGEPRIHLKESLVIMSHGLAGQIAVVTGGGSGIGLAIVKLLLSQGCKVACGGRTLEKLQEVKALLKAGDDNLLVQKLDVASEASVQAFFQQVKQTWGDTNILINSAGVNVKQRMMRELSLADWNMMQEINSTGLFLCSRAVLPAMRHQKSGLIINISSVAGLRSGPLGGIGYNASKFAATGFGICLGSEERMNGIRVTNIYPGEVDTPILANRPNPVSDEHRLQILQPEDVAAAVELVINLPARARIPELTIIPTIQDFV